MEELKRRLLAAMHAHGITFDDLLIDGEPGLIIGSGAEKPLTVVKRNDHGALSLTKTARTLPHYLKTRKIDVAMFDPMVELHQAEENNNVEMGYVARVFRSMAKGANCAVLLVHHTRKPPSGDSAAHVGNMDSSRGAGSVMGVSRMALTLYTIDQGEADRRGVSEEERHRYVRLDDAKNNLALSGGEPVFFRREGVNIRDFEEEPEEIGVLSWVQLEKRKSRKESAEDDLLDAVALVVGSVRGGRMPAVEVAERLIASDPIYSGASREGLSKAVKRVAVCEKATALGMTMQEATWPGRKRTMVISVCPESLESSIKSET